MGKKSLQILFEEMSKLTQPKCAQCKIPFSCCSQEYCEIAKNYAKEKGIELIETNHPKLPFMGPNGCIVPPYLRPLCTLHVCSINSLGYDPQDPKFTEKYFQLREQIEENFENE